MHDAVLIGDLEVGGTRSTVREVKEEVFGGEGWVRVEHVNLLGVGAKLFEEREAIGFVFGKGLFVTEDDVVGIVVKVSKGDESATLPYLGLFAGLSAAGDGIAL
jgi:hypothetical protein